MSVRNNHVRQSSPYVYKTIDGVTYQFSGAAWVYKTKVRYIANKAALGKIKLDKALRGVVLQEDGSLRMIEL